MPDLTFSSKGTAQVLADQQKLADGAKAMAALYKEENREIAKLGRDASTIFNRTRTKSERLRADAEKLRAVIANTKLPDVDRAKATESLKRVEGKLKAVESAGREAGGALTDAFGEGKSRLLGSFATGVGAVATAVTATMKIIVDEMRAAQDLANKAAATQMSVAAARNVVIRNMPGATDEEIQRVLSQNQEMAAETGVSEVAINAARASALSSSGGDIAKSMAATRVASQFLPDRPSEIGGYAGTLLDLSKVTGTGNAMANLGLQAAVGGLSRVDSPQHQATNIPKALIGAKGFGMSTPFAAAMFAAISNASADDKGETSGTALIALAEKLEAYTGDDGELADMSTDQKLRAIQANREMALDFYGKGEGFGIKSKAPIRNLLTDRNSVAARSFEDSLRKVPRSVEALAAEGQRTIDKFQLNPLESRANLSRGLNTFIEQARVRADAPMTTDEIALLQEALQRTGGSNTGSRLDLFLEKFSDGESTLSRAEAASALEKRRKQLLSPLQFSGSAGVGAPGTVSHRAPTEEEKRSAAALEKLIELMKENTNEVKKGRGIPAGAG